MKKRNIIFIAAICLLLCVTVVAAATPYERLTEATGTMGKAVKSVVDYFFGGPGGKLNVDLLLKFIVFLAMAVGLFELITLYGVKRPTAAAVGGLVSLGLILVIPTGVILGETEHLVEICIIDPNVGGVYRFHMVQSCRINY